MADRIGVISKGELIVVEDKHVLMRKLGKKQLTLQLQQPLDAVPERACRSSARALGRRRHADLHVRHADERDRHRRRCCAGSASTASTSRTCIRARARWRTSSSAWSANAARNCMSATRSPQRPRDPRDLPLRDGAHVPHDHAEHRLAGAVDVALLRRVRRGDRLAHGRDRRRQLRRVHRARADHAVAPEREHLERLVRHLHAEVGRARSTSCCPRRSRTSKS